MDTTSDTLSRILRILAERPDVQQRLRAEIVEASLGGGSAYDHLMQLPSSMLCVEKVCGCGC